MFWNKNKKNRYTPCKPQCFYIKLGFKEVYTTWTCFPDDAVSLNGTSFISSDFSDNITIYYKSTGEPCIKILICVILVYRSLRGAVVMSLALKTRGRRFDPGLVQSVGWDYKPRSHLHMTLAVGGTLNPNQPTNHSCLSVQNAYSFFSP